MSEAGSGAQVTEEQFPLVTEAGKPIEATLTWVKGQQPPEAAVILGHGAGGNSTSGNLPKLAAAFAEAGLPCVRFNCSPPNLALRVRVCQAVLESAGRHEPLVSVKRWVLAGHSMGGRVASEIAHQKPDKVVACVFSSYPTHPPEKPDELRDMPLTQLTQPLLFLRGTADTFSTAKAFESVLQQLKSSHVEVHTVEGGDHGLKVKGGAKVNAQVIKAYCKAAAQFAVRWSRSPDAQGPSTAAEEATATDAAQGSEEDEQAAETAEVKPDAPQAQKAKAAAGNGKSTAASDAPPNEPDGGSVENAPHEAAGSRLGSDGTAAAAEEPTQRQTRSRAAMSREATDKSGGSAQAGQRQTKKQKL